MPVKAVENTLAIGAGNSWSGVGDLGHRAPGSGTTTYPHRPVGRRISHGVVYQVPRQRAKRLGIPRNHAVSLRVQGDVDIARHREDVAVGDGFGGYHGEIDRLVSGGSLPSVASPQSEE